MPEPQPGTGPAGQTRPTEPPAIPGGAAGPIPAQRGPADPPAPEPDAPHDAAADDATDEAGDGGVDDDDPAGSVPDAGNTAPVSPARPAAPATERVAPRWTGSAAVPPPGSGKRKRRWLETAEHQAPAPDDRPAGNAAPPQRNPTLELPAEEREALESRAPVDPWADADHAWDEDYEAWAEQPEHWQPPVGPPHPPLPATRPYPASPPPQHHPAPPPQHPAQPGTRPYPVSQPAPRHPAAPPGPPPGPPQRSSAPPALPAPRGPSAPERRKSKRSRDRQPPDGYGPQPAPPGWRAPAGYVPVAVRRRRRWSGFMTMLTLLTIACCCGCPAYYGKPMWEQYPASATLPAQVADLSLRDDSQSKRAAGRLEQDMRTAHAFAEGTFAGVYSDGNDKRVTIFGVTGFRFSPDKDLDAEVARLTDAYQLTDPQPIATGVRGEYLRCGSGRVESTTVVACTWADHGSLATALFDRRSMADSAQLVGDLRENIVKRG